MTPAEIEREKVVAWLREQARECEKEQEAFPDWKQEWLYLREQVETFEVAADAIEAGQHLTGGQE